MKKKLVNGAVFLASISCLVISVMLFYNQFCFIDEHARSAPDFYGGDLLLYLDWLRLGLLALLSIVSGIKLFRD